MTVIQCCVLSINILHRGTGKTHILMEVYLKLKRLSSPYPTFWSPHTRRITQTLQAFPQPIEPFEAPHPSGQEMLCSSQSLICCLTYSLAKVVVVGSFLSLTLLHLHCDLEEGGPHLLSLLAPWVLALCCFLPFSSYRQNSGFIPEEACLIWAYALCRWCVSCFLSSSSSPE